MVTISSPAIHFVVNDVANVKFRTSVIIYTQCVLWCDEMYENVSKKTLREKRHFEGLCIDVKNKQTNKQTNKLHGP
jgi:hypothetical protein